MKTKTREKRFNELIEKIRDYSDNSVAIYGTGNHTKILLDYLSEYKSKVKFLIEKNTKIKYKYGFEVKSMEDIKSDDIKAIIISSDVYQYIIYERIKSYENLEKILIYNVQDIIMDIELSYEECRVHWQDKSVKLHTKDSDEDFSNYANQIMSIMNLKVEDNILDVGCADGKIDYFIKNSCKSLKGFDFSEVRLKEAKMINPECSYWSQSFLETFKYKGFDKIFSYGVVLYAKPEDIEKVILNSLEAVKKGGKIYHLSVPDRDMMETFYKEFYGIPSKVLKTVKNDIKSIFNDGSYWHNMKQIKDICKKLNVKCKVLPETENGLCYRSNIIITK